MSIRSSSFSRWCWRENLIGKKAFLFIYCLFVVWFLLQSYVRQPLNPINILITHFHQLTKNIIFHLQAFPNTNLWIFIFLLKDFTANGECRRFFFWMKLSLDLHLLELFNFFIIVWMSFMQILILLLLIKIFFPLLILSNKSSGLI